MKVCTDACLFGAILANEDLQSASCLEIGAGTGLISLMLAQKNESVKIDAVEIDQDAAEQATENIAATAWAERINLVHIDILKFAPEKKFDFIFTNPPFFEDDLLSDDQTKNSAKHDATLTLSQLRKAIDQHLKPDGAFALLLPVQRLGFFKEEAAKSGFYLNRQILVKQTLKHKFFRGILFFQKAPTEPILSEMIIKEEDDNYTPEFTALLKDYYLYL